MTKFIPGGLPRYRHQRAGLRKLIEAGGRAALLFDPGLGKSATAIDYASLLALKSETGEARVLVVAPLSVVDGWVDQIEKWVSPQVNWWAEALGGSIVDRCETLVQRGPDGGKPRRRPLAWATNDQDFASSDHGTREALWEAGPTVALPTPRVIFQIVNIDTFRSRLPVPGRKSKLTSDLVLESVRKYQPDLMVVDESHLAKGNSSNSSKLLYRISKHVPRVVLLTGTVMPHSPLDVHAQWRLIDPYAFGQRQPDGSVKEATFTHFQRRFAILERSYAHPGMEVKGFKNLDQLHEVMAERAISVRKEDALDLPPVTDVVVPVHLSDREQDSYRRMRKDLLTQLGDSGKLATAKNKLVSLLRLRQITSGFVPAEDDDPQRPYVLGHSKIDVMVDLVRTTLVGERRVVIFCNFRAEISNLAERLSGDKGLTVDTITGDTSTDERILLRKRFASDSDDRMVLICQIQTVSLGINEFVAASHAIFGSLPWQRDQIVQARDRLNRIGQERPMTFWFCLAENSVDQVVYQSYLDRSNLEAAVLKHLKEG